METRRYDYQNNAFLVSGPISTIFGLWVTNHQRNMRFSLLHSLPISPDTTTTNTTITT